MSNTTNLKMIMLRPGEMASSFKALAAPEEDMGFCHSSSRESRVLFWNLQELGLWYKYMHTGETLIHTKLKLN